MRLVVDANILFAALLRGGWTRQLWFKPGVTLYAPRFILSEYLAHRDELRRKFNGSDGELDEIFRRLTNDLALVEDSELVAYAFASEHLTADPDDLPYLACALAVNADIWSNDHDFQGHERVNIWKTVELAKELGLLKL